MRISTLKAEYDTKVVTLKAKYKALMEEELEPARADLEAAVVEAYVAGKPIAAICREYGTSARITITNILTNAGVYVKGVYRGH